MATATATPTTTALFSFEKVLTQDYTDFYAIFDNTKDTWVEGYWVRVPEGATQEEVETAFSSGELVSEA